MKRLYEEERADAVWRETCDAVGIHPHDRNLTLDELARLAEYLRHRPDAARHVGTAAYEQLRLHRYAVPQYGSAHR